MDDGSIDVKRAARDAVYAMPLSEINPADPEPFRNDTWAPYFERLRAEDPVHWDYWAKFNDKLWLLGDIVSSLYQVTGNPTYKNMMDRIVAGWKQAIQPNSVARQRIGSLRMSARNAVGEGRATWTSSSGSMSKRSPYMLAVTRLASRKRPRRMSQIAVSGRSWRR